MSNTIESHLIENRVFAPSEAFAGDALLSEESDPGGSARTGPVRRI